MPRRDGFEATTEIRRIESECRRRPTPIVALTAHLGEDIRLRCLDVGMQAVLPKPFDRAQIVEAIETFAHRADAQEQTGATAA